LLKAALEQHLKEKKELENIIDTVETVSASMQVMAVMSDAMKIDEAKKETLEWMLFDYKELGKMFEVKEEKEKGLVSYLWYCLK